jgi:hypothetical protein
MLGAVLCILMCWAPGARAQTGNLYGQTFTGDVRPLPAELAAEALKNIFEYGVCSWQPPDCKPKRRPLAAKRPGWQTTACRYLKRTRMCRAHTTATTVERERAASRSPTHSTYRGPRGPPSAPHKDRGALHTCTLLCNSKERHTDLLTARCDRGAAASPSMRPSTLAPRCQALCMCSLRRCLCFRARTWRDKVLTRGLRSGGSRAGSAYPCRGPGLAAEARSLAQAALPPWVLDQVACQPRTFRVCSLHSTTLNAASHVPSRKPNSECETRP